MLTRRVFVPGAIALAFVIALAGCGAERSGPTQVSRGAGHDIRAVTRAAARQRARIAEVIRRFNQASLAGDSQTMCALVDPAKLRYLEQIGQPCPVSLGGTLTTESERDVRSRTITAIEITGDDAVARTHGAAGARDLALHRSSHGDWLLVGV